MFKLLLIGACIGVFVVYNLIFTKNGDYEEDGFTEYPNANKAMRTERAKSKNKPYKRSDLNVRENGEFSLKVTNNDNSGYEKVGKYEKR